MVISSNCSTFMKYTNKLLFCILLFYTISKCKGECELVYRQNSGDGSKEKELLKLLKPLNGLIFETKDVLSPEHYTYKVGICGGLENNTGAVQYGDQTHVLGLYNMTDIMGGTDWILLTYHGGDSYKNDCGFEHRRTKVMIVCDPDVFTGKLEILEERKFQNESDCYYLFELGSNVSCTPRKDVKLPSKLSSGSVFCILFFTVISVYLICGFLYKRIVIGAKGMEQIPNYSFWRDFGNLQADGCDFFCRCGPRQESNAYRGIDDHLKEEERDDQLLNM